MSCNYDFLNSQLIIKKKIDKESQFLLNFLFSGGNRLRYKSLSSDTSVFLYDSVEQKIYIICISSHFYCALTDIRMHDKTFGTPF